jgi:hypothetical protein
MADCTPSPSITLSSARKGLPPVLRILFIDLDAEFEMQAYREQVEAK